MQPLHNRATPWVICLAIFLAASCWPLHAAQLMTLNIDQVSYTATHSGNVPCSEYGHVTISVNQDPGVVQYLQITAALAEGSPAWLVRNAPVPDFISSFSTTVDLTQLTISRGMCVAGAPLLYGVTFTNTPIDTAPMTVLTETVVFGMRDDRAEGGIPDGPFTAGNLAPGGPPPNFVFVGGQTEQINRAGMGSVVQGVNECGPGAAANSMHWLNDQGLIDLGGDTSDQSLQKLKSDMIPSGWRGDGVTGKEFVTGKLRFAQRAEHTLNIDVHYQSDALDASLTVGNMTATRDGNAGPPTVAYLKEQMEKGQDVELKIDWLDGMGNRTGGHFVSVSGFSMAGNQNALWFNDDALQDGTSNGLRINHLAKIESEGNYMRLGGPSRNRVVGVIAESPRTIFTLGYVVNVVANTISGFLQNALGQLNPLGGFPIMAEGGPHSVRYSPAKRRMYISDYFGNNVTRYQLDPAAGGLMLEQTIPAGTDPISMDIADESGGQFLFVVDEGSNDLREWDINAPDGNMVPRGQFPLRGSLRPQFIVVTRDGKNAYVGSCGNPNCTGPGTINIFSIDINGNTTEISNSPVIAGMGTVWLNLDATETRLFAANQASGTITEFSRNASTGELMRQADFPAGPGVSSIVIDPTNRLGLATIGPVNAGIVYRYDQATGNLMQASTFPTGMFPVSGNFDTRGLHYYITNLQEGSIDGYTPDFNTATVTRIPGSPWTTGIGSFFDVFVELPGSPPPQP